MISTCEGVEVTTIKKGKIFNISLNITQFRKKKFLLSLIPTCTIHCLNLMVFLYLALNLETFFNKCDFLEKIHFVILFWTRSKYKVILFSPIQNTKLKWQYWSKPSIIFAQCFPLKQQHCMLLFNIACCCFYIPCNQSQFISIHLGKHFKQMEQNNLANNYQIKINCKGNFSFTMFHFHQSLVRITILNPREISNDLLRNWNPENLNFPLKLPLLPKYIQI